VSRRVWSHEVVALPGGRVIVVTEALALAFTAGPDLHGYGLKLPRYVVVCGGVVRVLKVDGGVATLDEVRAVYPEIEGALSGVSPPS
jgi:hypothetical protein